MDDANGTLAKLGLECDATSGSSVDGDGNRCRELVDGDAGDGEVCRTALRGTRG